MTDPCTRQAQFGDGNYQLSLNSVWVRKVLDIRGLHGANGTTPAACLARFEAGTYSSTDVERVIELALLGGGLSERDTEAVLDAHVRDKPIAANAQIAASVLVGLFVGEVK
jgi:hypothetical protein